uniref:Uncharacterized protein n=1 Tax=Globodera rostochiensis TaxID=31243 RepID=A0A914I7B5_GLORO
MDSSRLDYATSSLGAGGGLWMAYSETLVEWDVPSRRANGVGLLAHVRQALALSPQVHISSLWFLASRKSGDDVVMVGHMKSNGTQRRQRKGSGDVRFIEQRAKIRVPEEWKSKVARSPSVTSNKPRKTSKGHGTNNSSSNSSHFGLVDFRKRLERVQRFDSNSERDEKVPKTEERKVTNDNGAIVQMEAPRRGPIEALIIKHRAALEEDEAEAEAEDGLFCEWDTLSVECCSVQIPLHSRTPVPADGCSEASFVLVKKRLKVAWEHHHQQQQNIVHARRQSLTRRADNNLLANNNNFVHNPKTNSWMPDIAQEDLLFD